nr:PREDICTED: trichohyalin-like [Linepithema humile]
MREREESWRKEGERWEEGLKKVEGRVGNMEKRWEEKEGEKKRKVGEEGKVESRVRELEGKLERREREERKKNVIVKELKVGEGGRREAVERLMAEIGAKVEIEEMRGLGRNIERGTETLWVKLKKEEQKREVMRRKRELRGRKEIIREDLTWRERRMEWKLEEIAKEERRKGKRVWRVYGKVRIEEEWWIWDEENESWDVMVLSETWVGEKGWEKIKRWLPRGLIWGMQEAKRVNKKGRAMGGMIMGIRKDILENGTGIEKEKEGIMVGNIKIGEKRWKIIGVYVRREGIDRTLEELEGWMEKEEEEKGILMGGDFNARTGREGGGIEGSVERGEEDGWRMSRDKKVDKEGKNC